MYIMYIYYIYIVCMCARVFFDCISLYKCRFRMIEVQAILDRYQPTSMAHHWNRSLLSAVFYSCVHPAGFTQPSGGPQGNTRSRARASMGS